MDKISDKVRALIYTMGNARRLEPRGQVTRILGDGSIMLMGGRQVVHPFTEWLEVHLDFRSRVPDTSQYVVQLHSEEKGVYVTTKLDTGEVYYTHSKGCTCESWSEQEDVANELGVEPLCKHQALVAQYEHGVKPWNHKDSAAWQVVTDGVSTKIQTYVTRDGKSWSKSKVIEPSELIQMKAKCVAAGWLVQKYPTSLTNTFNSKHR